MRVLILGAGAVGGYFGGKLLFKDPNNDDDKLDVTFLVRPGRAAQLHQDGLVLKDLYLDETTVIRPVKTLVASDNDSIQKDEKLNTTLSYDVIILTCKSFGLEGALETIAPYVTPKRTIILPLLNGMAHLDTIETRFPEAAMVVRGTCGIVASLDRETGFITKFTDAAWIKIGILKENEEGNGSSNKPFRKKPKFNKPKRPLTAYNYFFKEEREKILKIILAEDPVENNDPESKDYIDDEMMSRLKNKDDGRVSFMELAELIRKRWNTIDPDRLSKYSELAAEDTERYKNEMKSYNDRQEAKMQCHRSEEAALIAAATLLVRFWKRAGGIEAEVVNNIYGEMWNKWIFLASLGAANCLLQGSIGKIIKETKYGESLIHTIIDECNAVANAEQNLQNNNPAIPFIKKKLTDRNAFSLKSSMYRDMEQGICPTEAEHIIGDLIQRGIKRHIPTPLLMASYSRLQLYEAAAQR